MHLFSIKAAKVLRRDAGMQLALVLVPVLRTLYTRTHRSVLLAFEAQRVLAITCSLLCCFHLALVFDFKKSP